MERSHTGPAPQFGNTAAWFAALHALGRETLGLVVFGLKLSRGGSR